MSLTVSTISGTTTKLARKKQFWQRVERQRLWISLSAIAFVILAWQAVVGFGLVSTSILPPPTTVAHQFYVLQADGYRNTTLLGSLAISLMRMFIGFAVAATIGVPLGLLMGRNPLLLAVIDPFVQFFRPLPPLGYYTLLILWFGIGELSKDVLLFLSAIPIIIVGCAAATRNVRQRDTEAALSLGLNSTQIFWKVILPGALPEVMTSLRIALGTTFGSLVAAEIIAASSGLGYMVYNAANYLLTDIVFVVIIVLGLIAVLLDRMAVWIQRRLVPWQGKV